MSDFEAQVQLDLEGNLAGEAKRAERAIKALSTNAGRDFKRLRTASVGLSNGIDKLGNRYTGLITGGAFALAAKGVVDFDKKIKAIQTQAGLTGDQVTELKNSIFDIAQDPNIRLNPNELLAGFDAIIERTGDFKLAQENLENLGLGIRAVGASGGDIGATISGLEKLKIVDTSSVRLALEGLIEQGKAGAFTFRDLAAEAGPLMAALKSVGQEGIGAVHSLGAVLQVTQQSTDSAAESSTAIQALIREVAVKGKTLEKNGIQVFDPDALAQGREKLLALDIIVRNIVKRTGGKMSIIGKNFGEEAQKVLKISAGNFAETGKFEGLDKFMAVQVTGNKIVADAASNATTMAAAIDSLNAAMTRLAHNNLSEPLQNLADALSNLGPEKLNELFNLALDGAKAAAGIWLVNKAIRGTMAGMRGVQSFRGKGLSGAGGKGKSLISGLAAASAQPVFVTNWPLNGMGGGGTGGDTFVEGGDKKKRSKIKRSGGPRGLVTRGGKFGLVTKAANALTNLAANSNALTRTTGLITSGARNVGRFVKGSAPIALTLGALNMSSAVMEGDTRGALGAGGSIAGGLAGMQAGAAGGAMLGSVVPVVGTAIGGFLGGLVGGGLGAYYGEEGITALYDQFTGDDDKKVQIDTQPLDDGFRGVTKALEDNTRAQLKRSPNPTPNPRRFGSANEYGGLQGGAL